MTSQSQDSWNAVLNGNLPSMEKIIRGTH